MIEHLTFTGWSGPIDGWSMPILVVLALAWFLWLACLVDALIRDQFRNATQLVWVLVLLLAIPPFGALIYLVLGPGKDNGPAPPPRLTDTQEAEARRLEAEFQARERRKVFGEGGAT